MLVNYKFLYKRTKLKLFTYLKSNKTGIKNNCLYDPSLNYLCTSKISQKNNWLIYSPLSRCPNRLLFFSFLFSFFNKGNSAYSCTSTDYCLLPYFLQTFHVLTVQKEMGCLIISQLNIYL